ncbi:MAG: hypothetical protein CME71_03075 [Halobacteriovorax sp.]|nr:hypothetical protein [Halobacteriovorax sp.]
MNYTIPTPPENSFRITLELDARADRLDSVLLEALKKQSDNLALQEISKAQFKKLFTDKKVLIKGQNAKAKSPINSGTTYIDILL